jgi:hypothetical protein
VKSKKKRKETYLLGRVVVGGGFREPADRGSHHRPDV